MAAVRVVIVSNLDSDQPFGQFLRPYHLGRALANTGAEVAHVGVDCARVDYGPAWSVGAKSLVALSRALGRAIGELRPQVVYAHELRGGLAGLAGRRGLPLACDFHSLPSVEWFGYSRTVTGATRALNVAQGARAHLAERALAARAGLLVAASDGVAAELSARYRPPRQPLVIPNGVTETLLEAPLRESRSPYGDGAGTHAVAVVPGEQTDANLRALDFLARSALALEQEQDPPSLHVVGSAEGPSARLLRYEGFQEDLLPWLEHADACLLPYPADAALCGGARNKLLEALARGRRLVTTREGLRGVEEAASWEGVEVAADDPPGFAAALVRATGAGAPTLDERRPALRRRLRWDARAEELADALGALARTG